MTCIFCDIVAKRAPAQIVKEWTEHIAFVPLNPVVEGHTLVIPREHIHDAAQDPTTTAETFGAAALLAREMNRHFNLITNAGLYAGQTVFHLHVHVVPRRSGDGLMLPWTGR